MATLMKTNECKPLEARRAFQTRPIKNCVIGAAVFAAIFLLVFLSLNAFIVGLIALVAAAGTYFYLETRAIFIECPKCQKLIDTSTPWLCGFKKCRNENTGRFPFIHECEVCHSVPKAYECHHCGNPIYFSPDRQSLHAAKCLLSPEPPPPPPQDPIKQKHERQAEEVKDAEHAFTMAYWEKEKEIVKSKPAVPPAPKPEMQETREQLQKKLENVMVISEWEADALKKVRAKFANDPDMLATAERDVMELAFIERERRARRNNSPND